MTDPRRLPPTMRVDKIVLDQLAVGASYVASHAMLERADLTDHLLDGLQFRLKSYVLADKVADDEYRRSVTWTTPTSWWQMFKDTYRDAWWLRRLVRRWPVQYEHHSKAAVVKVDRYLTYPDARIKAPQLGRPVIFERVTPFIDDEASRD